MVTVLSRTQLGMRSFEVRVNVEHCDREVYSSLIVGLSSLGAKSCQQRICATFSVMRMSLPLEKLRVRLVSSVPLFDEQRFDLAIFVALLIALDKRLEGIAENREFYGMLDAALLRPVKGLVPSLIAATELKRCCVVPEDNFKDGVLLPAAAIKCVRDVMTMLAHFTRGVALRAFASPIEPLGAEPPDFSCIPMERIKRALMLAAAGGHSLLLCGSDVDLGARLVKKLHALLPPLTSDQQLIVAQMLSLGGYPFDPQRCQKAPLRIPAANISMEEMFGSVRHPGEVSQASCGVLLLENATSFPVEMLLKLEKVLAYQEVTVTSTLATVVYPAQPLLVATLDSCPCQRLGTTEKCICSDADILQYRHSLPKELLRRFDIVVNLWGEEDTTGSQINGMAAYGTVLEVRRHKQVRDKCNARLSHEDIEQHCNLAPALAERFEAWMPSVSTSVKDSILRVARTIADAEKSQQIEDQHLQEAISFWRWPLLR